MPTYFARKAGNINAADVWATTPSGTAAAVTFVSGDVLVSNNFTITVNVSVDLGSAGQVRNDTTGGATAGGFFSLSTGVTLTAAAFSNSVAAVQFVNTGTASFVGSLNQIGNGRGIDNNGTGTINITLLGNFTGSSASNAPGFYNGNAGTINITSSGSFIGGGVSTSPSVVNLSNGIITFTGNITGGSGGAAINNVAGGVLNIVGNATGGSGAAGVNNASTGTVFLTQARGNAFGPGNTAGLAAAVGASNAGLGVIEIQQLEYGTNGMSPTSGTGIRLKKLGSNVAVFNFCDTAGAKTLIDATTNAAMPAASDVRSGVSYASGAQTGSCAVPAASSVAFGVPVDNTTGTAVLDPASVAAAVWGAATRTLTAGAGITAAEVWSHSSRTVTGGTVDTLTNAPTVPSASAIASAVWAAADKTGYSLTSAERTAIASAVEASILNEGDGQAILNAIVTAIGNTNISQVALVAAIRSDLATELGRIDAAISSRAVPGDIPTESEIASAVWEKPTTELTITGSIGERAKNQSTVSTTGAQLAAALS